MDTIILAVRVLLSLAVVLALLWFVRRRMSRGRTMRSANPIRVVSKQGIGQKASVVIVEVEGDRFILGVTEQSVSVLHTQHAGSTTEVLTRRESEPAASAVTTPKPIPGELLRPRRRRNTRLDGSILSAATWRQTAAAFRQDR